MATTVFRGVPERKRTRGNRTPGRTARIDFDAGRSRDDEYLLRIAGVGLEAASDVGVAILARS